MKRYWLLLIGFPLTAVPAAFASCEGRGIERARRIYATAPRGEALIVSKHAATSSNRKGYTTTYHVTLESPAGGVTRRVRRAEYEVARPGLRTAWYADPAGGEGLSEIERGWRTDEAGYGVLLGIAFLAAVILCRGSWQGLPGGAAEGRVRAGGPACPETKERRLPAPPRDPEPWERWLRRKYPPAGFILWPSLGVSLLIAVPAAALGGWETAAVQAFLLALTAWTVFLSGLRGRRRDRLLWARGEERHAVLREARRTGNVHRYEVSFEFGGRIHTLRQRMPIEGEAQRVDQDRVAVLVDPLRPKRATVVPRLGV